MRAFHRNLIDIHDVPREIEASVHSLSDRLPKLVAELSDEVFFLKKRVQESREFLEPFEKNSAEDRRLAERGLAFFEIKLRFLQLKLQVFSLNLVVVVVGPVKGRGGLELESEPENIFQNFLTSTFV